MWSIYSHENIKICWILWFWRNLVDYSFPTWETAWNPIVGICYVPNHVEVFLYLLFLPLVHFLTHGSMPWIFRSQFMMWEEREMDREPLRERRKGKERKWNELKMTKMGWRESHEMLGVLLSNIRGFHVDFHTIISHRSNHVII